MNTLKVFAFALIIAIVAAAGGDDDDGVKDPDVIVLTDKNFDEIVGREELMLVEFYAPWCGHCKRLKPEFAQAATTLKANDPPVRLGKVDATKFGELAGKYKVNGYPKLFVFRNGKESDYNGPREAKGIVDYMKKQVGPAAKPINSVAEHDKFAQVDKDRDFAVIGYFSKDTLKSSQLYASFLLVASKLREDVFFAISTDPAISAHAGVTGDAVIAYKTYDDKKTVYSGTSKVQALQDWVVAHSLPIVGEFKNDNAARYQKRGLPIAKFFGRIDFSPANQKQMQYFMNRLVPAAKEVQGKIVVTVANVADFQSAATEYGIKGKDATALVIENGRSRYKSELPFNAQNVKQFFDDFLAGKAEKFVKSEPLPDNKNKDVKVIVGKNFDQVVDDSKDVLIEFYAPWCGHCKALEPKYEKLGKKFAGVDSVVIAKIDATANDYPETYQVSGFPTVYFKPAGKNSTPIKHEGEREVADFVKFIKKNSKTKWSFKKNKK